MMREHFKILDLTNKRDVYVVGDIHGCFSQLEKQLAEFNFDPKQDFLLSVGDLVDRGPESERVLEFLDQPWFASVQGNHDEWCAHPDDRKSHKKHGGKWFWKLYYNGNLEKHNLIRAKLSSLPTIIEAHLPDGKRIGIVHAGYPFASWRGAKDNADFFGTEMRWGRTIFKQHVAAAKAGNDWYVDGIDHLYHGHNVINRPFHTGNISWLDTGACWPEEGGHLTIVKAND